MISFEDAKNLVMSFKLDVATEKIACSEAVSRIVAEDILAPIDLPPFDNSAVDGFAVESESYARLLALPVSFTLRAAMGVETLTLPPNQAAKIMTGAPIPLGADAVIMKEDVDYQNGLVMAKKPVGAGDHIRCRGEDIQKNEVAVRAGTVVSPRMVGLLHALGCSEVLVMKPPSVAIIGTGDELVRAGDAPLKFGQVYYLMGPMLRAQCTELGVTKVTTTMVPDDLLSIIRAIDEALQADIVLLTGGMSKGDYDLVRPALKHCGVAQVFFEGAWRPGKPLYFGKKNNTAVFGLPGNPNAAFVCFHTLVRPFIIQALKREFHEVLPQAALSQDYLKKPDLTIFLLAERLGAQQLCPLPRQGSHQINSLCKAHALAVLPKGDAIVKAGDLVHYYPL